MATQKRNKKAFRKNRSKKQKGGVIYTDDEIALINAIRNNNISGIEKALENGVDIDFITNELGNTPLMFSYIRKKYDITNLLLEKGANVNKKNSNGNTMLIVCINSYISEDKYTTLGDAKRLIHLDIMNKIIEKGADVNVVNNYDETPFIIAARAAAEQEEKMRNYIAEDEEEEEEVNFPYEIVKLLIEKYDNIKFLIDEHFAEAIDNWNNNSGIGTWVQYIPGDGIQDWDVSNITDMSELANNDPDFNYDISNWDVSNVTDMANMFSGALNFNQDISRWNVSNVADMTGMFHDAHSFNQYIGNWNVSNVTNMQGMFNNARSFNQDIGNWDVSNVTDMREMFFSALNFNQDISRWNINDETSMQHMFTNSGLIANNSRDFLPTQIEAIERRFNQEFDDEFNYEEFDDEFRIGSTGTDMCYQIHNKFTKINIKKYIETINKYLINLNEENPFFKDGKLLSIRTRENREHIVKEIERVSRIAFDEHIKGFAEPEKTNKLIGFDLVIKKFAEDEKSQELIHNKLVIIMVLSTFAYVWSSQWNNTERGNYIHTWITDNIDAYDPNQYTAIPVSCSEGIFERFVESLTVILAKDDLDETQKEIFNIINIVLPDMGEIFKLWLNNTDNDEKIKTLIANAKTEENVFAFASSEDDKKTLRDSFTEFAKNIYEEHGKTLITDDYIFKEYIENIGEYIQYGGRRYHKLKKTKLTRKTKTVKQNKKQKRKTQKKNNTQKRKTQKRKNK